MNIVMNETAEIFYREKQVLALFAPVHRTTWWRWVKSGMAPAPVRLGKRITVWRKSDLEHWQNNMRTRTIQADAATDNQPNPA